MVTVTEFLIQLVVSFVDMILIMIQQVALRSPIAVVLLAMGAVLLAYSVGYLGYLTLGALADAVARST